MTGNHHLWNTQGFLLRPGHLHTKAQRPRRLLERHQVCRLPIIAIGQRLVLRQGSEKYPKLLVDVLQNLEEVSPKRTRLGPATYRSTQILLCSAINALLIAPRGKLVLHGLASHHDLDSPKANNSVCGW
jgi:hypothetical protein